MCRWCVATSGAQLGCAFVVVTQVLPEPMLDSRKRIEAFFCVNVCMWIMSVVFLSTSTATSMYCLGPRCNTFESNFAAYLSLQASSTRMGPLDEGSVDPIGQCEARMFQRAPTSLLLRTQTNKCISYTCTYKYTHIYTEMYTCTHTYIHTHIYTCTHPSVSTGSWHVSQGESCATAAT